MTGIGRLDALFTATRDEGRAALIGYLPAGYPTTAGAAAMIDTVIDGGADAIEVGIPFSDPVLDGPTISTAQREAIAAGFRTGAVFGLVERVAARGAVPVVMSYINPILAYGLQAFARDLASAGGTGVIIPDLIVDEADQWRAATAAHGLAPIFLVAPSSPAERLARTTDACRGFVYAASLMGTTGARQTVSAAAADLVRRTRTHTSLPVAVGLGVRSADQASRIASFADAVIVGSALVDAGRRGTRELGALVAELAGGVRTPARTGTPA